MPYQLGYERKVGREGVEPSPPELTQALFLLSYLPIGSSKDWRLSSQKFQFTEYPPRRAADRLCSERRRLIAQILLLERHSPNLGILDAGKGIHERGFVRNGADNEIRTIRMFSSQKGTSRLDSCMAGLDCLLRNG